MARVLIVGCGNPLRGDDGLAWRALIHLERRPKLEGVQMVYCHQFTPDLAEPVSQAERVIFVDARIGDTPGTLERRRIEPDSSKGLAFSHQCDPSALLDYAEQLYGKRPEAYVVSVVGESFGYLEELSGPVRSSMTDLLQAVEELAIQGGLVEERVGAGLEPAMGDHKSRPSNR